MRRIWRGAVVIGAATACAVVAGGAYVLRQIDVDLPVVPAVQKSVWLEQNWSKAQRDFYHGAQQGAATFGVPYEWFTAVERPVVSLSSPGLFSDAEYLDRLGFIPSDDGSKLPVGFESGEPMVNPTTHVHWTNPQTGRDMTTIGLTCAACHTGRMTYKGTQILVDGGAAMIDVNAIRRAVVVSLYLTRYLPYRFDRFAERILGPNPRPEAKAELMGTLDKVLAGVQRVVKLNNMVVDKTIEEGIGRLDALNRIGNELFASGLDIDSNYAAMSAPVRYPHIWDSSRFDWVEYNSSIQQPMIRNVGEALGLGVAIDLAGTPTPTFRSGMNIKSIYRVEALLRGPAQPTLESGVTGLRAPVWPADILPPIDQARAAKGAILYKELCQSCHLPPIGTAAFYDPKLRQDFGPEALIVPFIPVSTIGTDPAQAEDMANRKVEVPASLGLASNAFGPALGQIVEKALNAWYDAQTPPISPDQRFVMNGELPNGVRTPIAYKARPLDGIWSTGPYLHNGSVPTLYALLSPVVERPKVFTIGSREFDPADVGLKTDAIDGGTRIDTSVRGDRNTGHAFDDVSGGPGVIGRKLNEDERRDLVEYLKTL